MSSIKTNVYRYAGSKSALMNEPMYALFSNKGFAGCDWIFVTEVDVHFTDDMSPDDVIQEAVSAIDKEIHTKRVQLEEDLDELRKRKQELLCIEFNNEKHGS